MDLPTKSDITLLQIIATLVTQHGGRPPTFAEVATAAGLPSSSRGSVQRQLARLRGRYVDWGSSSRSLILTPNGLALIGESPSASTISQKPLPDLVLPLLASGLMVMTQDLADGRPPLAPFPDAWQRGLNIFAVECLLRGVEPPSHTQAAIALCKKPPSEWPVRVALQARTLDHPLLDEGDQPTALCRELSEQIAKGNPEHELCEHLMLKIREIAAAQRNQNAYVALRSFIIRRPVVAREDLIDAVTSPEMGIFGRDLFELYEQVPASAIEHEHVRLCGHCGWTLERYDGRMRCAGDYCSVLTDSFTRDTASLAVPPSGMLMRARKAIRQYVVAPGRYEVGLYDTLRAEAISAELWPDFDAYDLRIPLGDETWAVDLKDWTYAHLLAPKLMPFRTDTSDSWDRAFYVIPDARARDESYLTFLKTATAGQPFGVVTVSELCRMIRERRQGRYA